MRKFNVVIVVCDTLRGDKAQDLLAKLPGFRAYHNAVSPAPWTLPSHVSMLTGLYPNEHGSHEDENLTCDNIVGIRNQRETLASKLGHLGYHTYGFSANIFVSPEYGFTGFDWFKNLRLGWPHFLSGMSAESAEAFKGYLSTRSSLSLLRLVFKLSLHDSDLLIPGLKEYLKLRATEAGKGWPIDKGGSEAVRFTSSVGFTEPFFLFINLLEAHEPYLGDDTLNKLVGRGLSVFPIKSLPLEDIRKWTEGYNFQVSIIIERVNEILSCLSDMGLLQSTLVIITSDHGQLLGEHGWVGHGIFLFDELLRVPLLVKYPDGVRPIEIAEDEYISLTRIPRFIVDMITGSLSKDSLYSHDAFAESWGPYEKVQQDERFTRFDSSESKSLRDHRIAVYGRAGKVTYNATTQRVEEYLPIGSGSLGESEELKEKSIRFGNTRSVHRSVESNEGDEKIYEQLKRMGYV